MSPEGTKRKLTAILSADVKGYSRLMEDDEEATVATLTSHRAVMTKVIDKHSGRVVDAPGDNLLAEFASVVDAMRGAVEIQEELRARNSELPDHRRMEFRIGINLGDVIEEEGRIYGDGVNIAARVESLADGGGICVSGSAYEQIRNKLSLGTEFLGEHEVKNISVPVQVYRLVMEPDAAPRWIKKKKAVQPGWRWATTALAAVVVIGAVAAWQFYLRPKSPTVEPASVERMAFPLPEKPSIAVLPFDNMSGDPEQEYIADGISENIIAALAKIPQMFVIARNSTFSYKGKSPKVQQVAEELGVRHVLEGSVQRSGDRIRVTAQLIDALTGHHLWSEMYDRRTEDLFDLLDGITMEIVVALQVKLTEGDQARVRQDTDSLEALGYWVQAQPLWDRVTKGDHAKARELLEKAVAIDPEYVSAWARLGHLHYTAARLARYGWSDSRDESTKRAEELADKALAMDASHPEANALMGHVHLLRREHDEALTWFRKAVAFGPNDADVHAYLAIVLRWTGTPEESILLLKQAMRLQPTYPWWYVLQLGRSYREAERYEEAIATIKQLLDPRWGDALNQKLWVHVVLASCYAFLDRIEEARAQVVEWQKIVPDLSMERVSQYIRTAEYFQDSAYEQRLIEAWRKAGVPERYPPLPQPNKPSIAVLPFANMSGDSEQEFFADGMTDDLITDLSKISGLFVIARNSVFSYKGQSPKVQQVSRDLGVRYVLEGSVRRAGDQVRINAQLIDATTGGHLWAERYDGKLADIFALQDKINRKIVTALTVKLTADEQEKLGGARTENIQAYDAFLKGREHYLRATPEDSLRAVDYFERAIELDPSYARAYAALALLYSQSTQFEGSHARRIEVSWAQARLRVRRYMEMAMRAPTSEAHQVMSFLHLSRRRYKEAIAELESAIARDPGDAESHGFMGYVLALAGKPEEAMSHIETALRLDPLHQASYLYYLGIAHFALGKLEEAVGATKRANELNPERFEIRSALLAAAQAHLGRQREARLALDNYERCFAVRPPYLKWIMYLWPFKDQEVAERFAHGLLNAGLSGRPGGYYKILEENRMTGKEIKDLVLGRSATVSDLWKYGRERIHRARDGTSIFQGHIQGKSWIDGDELCDQWPTRFEGQEFCGTVFRNPDGAVETNDEYMRVNDLTIEVFSLHD